LALYPRTALCQRNPLPIQTPPTSSNSRHPTRDHSSQESGTRQDPCSYAPELIPSSSMLRSLASYPGLALCQRNPLPIQIPPTYNHSCHPTPDSSSQETGSRQDPCPHTPELNLSSFRLRSFIAIMPQASPVPKESSPNSNPSHLQPLLPSYTGPLIQGIRDQTRPMFTCTQSDPLEF
jgi:hypothetical protein